MNLKRIAATGAVLALSVTPAMAIADPGNGNGNGPPTSVPPSNQGTAHNPNGTGQNTPGPNASMPTKAKAYGKFCQGESKKHVAGTPGTPFSKCVTDAAKAAHNGTNPTTACKNESKKHVKGQKGTPYSLCVSAAAKAQNEAQQQS
jgi:hypothetical protein